MKIFRPFRHFFENIYHVLHWIPVIWKDRDWDYSFIYFLLEFKLKNMIHFFKNYTHTAEPTNTEIINTINECVKLLDKIQNNNYSQDALKQIGFKDKYPDFKLHMEFVPVEGHEKEYSTINWNFENEEQEKYYNQNHAVAEQLETNDIDRLFDLMAENIRNWWD